MIRVAPAADDVLSEHPGGAAMDPRAIIKEPKTITSETPWSCRELPPRYSVFPKRRHPTPKWQWKAANLRTEEGREYCLLVQALPQYDNWKAWLIVGPPKERSVIARLEHHGQTGEGLHIHADCRGDRPIVGPESIEAAKHRLPAEPLDARRKDAWTRDTFWGYACRLFRIRFQEPQQGELL